jgi:hypothetical protein
MKILLPHEAASEADVPGRHGDLRLDEPDPVGTQVVEQPDTVTEQQRREVDHHLVEQTGSEVLLRYVRAFYATPTVSLRPQGIGRSLICQARVHDVAERLVGMLRPASALDGGRHAEEGWVEVAALIISAIGSGTGAGLGADPDAVQAALQATATNADDFFTAMGEDWRDFCPAPPTLFHYDDPTLPDDPPAWDALCEGDADLNGFYGDGVVDALAAANL